MNNQNPDYNQNPSYNQNPGYGAQGVPTPPPQNGVYYNQQVPGQGYMAPLPQKKKSNNGIIVAIVCVCVLPIILGILVAVAVPIFSATTNNARTKTCVANQREIISRINSAQMAGTIQIDDGDVYILTTNSGGYDGEWSGNSGSVVDIEQLFDVTPCCPVENNQIKVTVTSAGLEGYKITTECIAAEDESHGSTGGY